MPASQRRTVAIRRTKEGFTCTVLSNAAGKLVKLQMIWQGATALVHAQPEEKHPKIYQDHRPDSHFQNADTFGRLAVFIVNHIKNIRAVEGQDVPAIMIVDAAAQHKEYPVWKDNNIRVKYPHPKPTYFNPPISLLFEDLKSKLH